MTVSVCGGGGDGRMMRCPELYSVARRRKISITKKRNNTKATTDRNAAVKFTTVRKKKLFLRTLPRSITQCRNEHATER